METMTNKNDTKDTPYDFGDDAEAMPPDPAFDAWITRVAPTLNAPNATPRLEMWQAIQAQRRASGDGGRGPGSPGVIPLRRRPWGLMSAIAAALLLGVAIDRFALRRTDRAAEPVIAGPSSAGDSADPARLYRMAAAQTLTQAEALLTAYRASGAPDRSPLDAAQLGKWGREVLSSTRLLIDSPAGDDPQLRALLDDLELVLVQVIQLSGAPLDPADRELIDRALADRDLLPRIRTAVPAGITGSASAD
jgi:hypothetical protein